MTLQETSYDTELEVALGIEEIAFDELQSTLRNVSNNQMRKHNGAITLRYAGDLRHLNSLKTVDAVYLCLHYEVPRPRALLGHEHFHRLLDHINIIREHHPRSAFKSFYISAAGKNSSVMQRLQDELSQHTGLISEDESGDLLIRIRRAKPGWDVLLRTTPRPLATREWRVCNLEGALNGPVARAMVNLSTPEVDDRVLNIMCGSGTLMIERLQHHTASQTIGCDIDAYALACAEENLNAAKLPPHLWTLIQADTVDLPLLDTNFNCIYADLPFGQLIGSHKDNVQLYPQVLRECARVAALNCRFIAITHEVRLMESILKQTHEWQIEKIYRVTLRGLHPRIYVLRKR